MKSHLVLPDRPVCLDDIGCGVLVALRLLDDTLATLFCVLFSEFSSWSLSSAESVISSPSSSTSEMMRTRLKQDNDEVFVLQISTLDICRIFLHIVYIWDSDVYFYVITLQHFRIKK